LTKSTESQGTEDTNQYPEDHHRHHHLFYGHDHTLETEKPKMLMDIHWYRKENRGDRWIAVLIGVLAIACVMIEAGYIPEKTHKIATDAPDVVRVASWEKTKCKKKKHWDDDDYLTVTGEPSSVAAASWDEKKWKKKKKHCDDDDYLTVTGEPSSVAAASWDEKKWKKKKKHCDDDDYLTVTGEPSSVAAASWDEKKWKKKKKHCDDDDYLTVHATLELAFRFRLRSHNVFYPARMIQLKSSAP
uniref:Major sperm protein n=1 Tax=Echinostoma caproni TaxID=27848 RepID=A0A183AE72_9TREM